MNGRRTPEEIAALDRAEQLEQPPAPRTPAVPREPLTRDDVMRMYHVIVDATTLRYINDNLANHPEKARDDAEYVLELISGVMTEE